MKWLSFEFNKAFHYINLDRVEQIELWKTKEGKEVITFYLARPASPPMALTLKEDEETPDNLLYFGKPEDPEGYEQLVTYLEGIVPSKEGRNC